MHTSYSKIANKIIEWGMIFLIAFTPIAFGTVHPWAYTIMELTVCFLVIIWIIRLGLININKTTTFPSRQPSTGSKRHGMVNNLPEPAEAGQQIPGTGITPNYELPDLYSAKHTSHGRSPNSDIRRSNVLVNRFGFIKTPLTIPIIIFVGLILFQLTPLPPGVLKIISPNTYELYKTTLPDWQTDESINQLINESQNSQTAMSNQQLARTGRGGSTIQSWQSISMYKHATKIELYKVLAYIGIFFLIVNYNPSTRSRQPRTRGHPRLSDGQGAQIKALITRLIIAMLVVGCFESIYGLLECLSGHQHIFFRKKISNYDTVHSVAGTYINRNHFAGYMAIVICMSFGYITYLFSDPSKSRTSEWRQRLILIINQIGTRAGVLSFLILIMSCALIMSGSRMGICSFIAVIFLMSIMLPSKAPTQRGKAEFSPWKMYVKKIALIILPVCLLTVWIGLNPVIKRFSGTSKDMKAEEGRVQVWKDSCNLVKDFPAFGTGFGTYEYVFPKYKTFKRQVLYDHAHNDYVELISDTGFTGFIIAIAGAVYYLFVVTRLWFQGTNSFVRCIAVGCLGGIAYILLHSLTDFNLHIPANALHLSIITGIMYKTVTQL